MTRLNQHRKAYFSTRTDSEHSWYESDVLQTLKYLDLMHILAERRCALYQVVPLSKLCQNRLTLGAREGFLKLF